MLLKFRMGYDNFVIETKMLNYTIDSILQILQAIRQIEGYSQPFSISNNQSILENIEILKYSELIKLEKPEPVLEPEPVPEDKELLF